QVYDAGKDATDEHEVSYIVMEYVSGGDLKEMMEKEGPLSGKELSKIGASLAAGLAHAHERGVIHRDIKPQNVLLDEYGRPKLTDFGIARALDATVQTTRTGSYLGTALYSAPEQLKGEEVTPKSDVYSLGVTLYHATVGEPPFSGGPIEVASQQMTRDPEPPRGRGAKITPEMETLIMACLSRDPDGRPTSGELQTKLLQAGAVVSSASEGYKDAAVGAGALQKLGDSGRADGLPEGTVVFERRDFRGGGRDRGLMILAAAALLFLLFAAFGAWTLMGGGGDEASDPSADAARQEEQTQGGGSDEEQASSGEEEQQQQNEQPSQEEEQADQDSQQSEPGPLPPTEQAASAVYDMYVALPFGRFDESWNYLSSGYQEEVGSIEEWRQRYESVSYVSYPQAPQATLDGRQARVDFTAELTRPDGPETVSGTWIAVSEDGEWKLDRLEETASSS
ncbi:MAG: serine/threonine-protein kinase, partial [Rubrobacteraceae bacterium]